MVEWSITAVLKTVELKGSGGSNPSLSANNLKLSAKRWAFFVQGCQELAPVRTCAGKAQRLKAVSFKLFARAPAASGQRKARPSGLISSSPQKSGLQISVSHFFLFGVLNRALIPIGKRAENCR